MKEHNMTKIEVMQKVSEILSERCEDPSAELIKQGEAIKEIGKAIKGMSLTEARATLNAVAELEGVL